MQIILSPAKQININQNKNILATPPFFLDKTEEIHRELKRFSVEELKKIYGVSQKIAEETYRSILEWNINFKEKAGQAIFSYCGAVFQKVGVQNFSASELQFAEDHLTILSAFYGALSPCSLMKPYRLDMKVKLKLMGDQSLYTFWKKDVTSYINDKIKEDKTSKILMNLASDEFFKIVDLKSLEVPVITPVFKEKKGGMYKTVGMPSKQARGLMTRFIIQNKLDGPEGIKLFSVGGYQFNPGLSDSNKWVFTR